MQELTKAEATKSPVQTEGLPEEFLAALEAEYCTETQRREKLHNDHVGELIVSCRDEATQLFLQAEADHVRMLKNAEDDGLRSLRTIDNDGAHKVFQARMANLEKKVYELLQQRRADSDYPRIVADFARKAYEVTGAIQQICAPEPEASALQEMYPNVDICLTPENHWGGFILIGKGGTVLDSTFRTRWQALQKMASAEFSAEL